MNLGSTSCRIKLFWQIILSNKYLYLPLRRLKPGAVIFLNARQKIGTEDIEIINKAFWAFSLINVRSNQH